MPGTRSLYGFTKYAAELLIAEYQAMFGLEAVVNRCGVIAGPGQFGKVDQGVIALWVMRHHSRLPLRYTGYGGSGKQVRDVLHVDDVADLITAQVARFPEWNGWSGNVSGGRDRSVSLQELTRLCAEVTGHHVDITPDPAPRQADLRIFIGDSRRLARERGWTPQRSIATVVADVHDWVRREEPSLKRLGLL